MQKEEVFEIVINSLDEKGYGTGQVLKNNTTYNVKLLNALPLETIKAKVQKKKNGIVYAEVVEVLTKSQFRIEPKEPDHFLSCSPFQILDNSIELQLKLQYIKNSLIKSAQTNLEELAINLEIEDSPLHYNYRNKVEFGFFEDWDTNTVSLSYFKRGGFKGKYQICKCELLNDKMNKAACAMVEVIYKHKISSKVLKYLLIKHSIYDDKVSINLFVKDKESFFNSGFDFETVFSDIKSKSCVKGLRVIYSNPLSPASVNNGVLYEFGTEILNEKVGDIILQHDTVSFFQVNVPLFEILMKDLKQYLIGIDKRFNLKKSVLLDFYCGVGTIGLYLSSLFKGVVGIENSLGSQKLATTNAEVNQIKNVIFYEIEASKVLNFIKSDDVLLMDPPRSGLDQKVLDKIVTTKPKLIIYVSCNYETLALNYFQLKHLYKIELIKAYNFYPNTPHVETLCVLSLID